MMPIRRLSSARCRSCPISRASVAGLGPGSDVTFQGLRIGDVTGVDMEYDGKSDTVVAPVHFEIEPQRIKNINVVANRGPLANLKILVAKGLRAQIQKANFLTGQSMIALVLVPNATARPGLARRRQHRLPRPLPAPSIPSPRA